MLDVGCFRSRSREHETASTDYRRELEDLRAERTLAFGTSALRDAENGEAFLGEVEWSYGFATRLLSGDDEALLIFRGVTAGRAIEPDTLIVDVGGGSTELVLGGPDGVSFHTSLDLGCVRMTERFGDNIDACAAHVRSALPAIEPHRSIGVAGTITSLAALDLGLVEYDPERVHSHVLSATPWRSSSSGSRRCRWRNGVACRASSPSARP